MRDVTEPMRKYASEFPEVEVGTSCSQTSFKTNGKAFLFVGEQGGRYKVMLKLQDSKSAAAELAAQRPADFQVGAWVTVRFSTAGEFPKRLWKRWFDESYALCR